MMTEMFLGYGLGVLILLVVAWLYGRGARRGGWGIIGPDSSCKCCRKPLPEHPVIGLFCSEDCLLDWDAAKSAES